MASKHGICPNCGRIVDLPEEVEAAYCPECGAQLTVQDIPAQAELREPERQPTQAPQQPEPRQPSRGLFAGDSPLLRTTDTPFLAQWKTDVLFTCLGLALRWMILVTIINMTGGQAMINEAMTTGVLTPTSQYIIAGGLFDMACAIAAFTIIPRRFRKEYAGSNHMVSFVNTLVGGLVFGLWWNSRLTKRRMGFSHLLFFVLLATNGLYTIIMMTLM